MRFDEGKLVIEIELGNDAMSRPEHVAAMLEKMARLFTSAARFESAEDVGKYPLDRVRKFRDANGNTCARWVHRYE